MEHICAMTANIVMQERQVPVVTWQHWQRIDEHEQSLGAKHSRPRVKLASVADMLAAAGLS